MNGRLLLLLILGCVWAAPAEVVVDGEFEGHALSLRLCVPSASYDDNGDGRLGLTEIQAHRVRLRQDLDTRVQVKSGGKVLRPGIHPVKNGRELLLIYGVPPYGGLTLQAGQERCRVKLGREAFELAPGEAHTIRSETALETLAAIALLLLCSGAPALLWLRRRM